MRLLVTLYTCRTLPAATVSQLARSRLVLFLRQLRQLDVEVEITQPAGTIITDLGHVATTATVGSANIVVRVGSASDGEEIIADANFVTSGVAAIGTGMQVCNASQGEGGAAMTLVAKFPLYTAAARTIYYRFQNSATITAGVIRPFLKIEHV